MSTFIDRAWEKPLTLPTFSDLDPEVVRRQFRQAISSSRLFDVGEVGEYFLTVHPEEDWGFPNDFPCLAPPFGSFFLELRRPPFLWSAKLGKTSTKSMPPRWAVLCQYEEFSDSGILLRTADRNRERLLDGGLGLFVKNLSKISGLEAKWTYQMTLFLESDDRILGPLIGMMGLVDPDGRGIPESTMTLPLTNDSKVSRQLLEGVGVYLWPAMFGLSLIHCKNAVVTEVDPPKKLTKSGHPRPGRQPTRYHVVTVGGMRQTLSEAGAESTGIHQALHKVRGHFKDYRSGKGLFGRVRGMFWWDEHSAGNEALGTILSDYRVEKPD